MEISDFKLYYSGGPGNSNPVNSVSGNIGNIITRGMTSVSNANPIPGVFIEDAVNINGTITLEILDALNNLRYTQNGVNSGQLNLVESANRAKVLKTTTATENSQLNIRYVGPSLPGVATSANVTIATGSSDLFPDISSQESLLGLTDYRLVYVRNDHLTDSATLKNFNMDSTDTGQAFTASIGDQGAATVNQAPLPAHEADPSIAPTYATTKTLNVLMGPGDRYYFWVRRIVAAASNITDPFCAVSFKIVADF